MKQLIIWRHGQAADGSPDHERKLTLFGRRQASIQAETMLQKGFKPELLLVSSALRTKQTAAGLLELCPETPTQFREDLYNAHLGELMKAVTEAPQNVDTLLLVAHNPGVSMLHNQLIGQHSAIFSPSHFSVVSFDVDDWELISYGTGSLVGYYE